MSQGLFEGGISLIKILRAWIISHRLDCKPSDSPCSFLVGLQLVACEGGSLDVRLEWNNGLY